MPGASVLVFDRELRYVLCAGGALAEHGIAAEDLEGRSCADVLPPGRWAVYEPMYVAALAGQASSTEVRDVDGEHSYVVDVGPRWGPDGTIIGGVAIARDVTAHRRVEGALKEAHQLFEQAFEQAPIGMALVGLDGRWLRVNRALCEITGYTAEELQARRFTDITHADEIDAGIAETRRLAEGTDREYHTVKRYLNKQGEAIWVNVSVSVVTDAADRPSYFITQVLDVSRQKRLEQRLRRLADYDSLTGLPNRRYFEETLAIQLGRCVRYDETAALLMLDLDNFKNVNDRYGHRAGDELLCAVASAIRDRIRASDIAGRLGGDEFAVLFLNPRRTIVDSLVAELADAVSHATIEVAGTTIGTAASVGATFIDAVSADPDTALVLADKAMYAEKARRVAEAADYRASRGVTPDDAGT